MTTYVHYHELDPVEGVDRTCWSLLMTGDELPPPYNNLHAWLWPARKILGKHFREIYARPRKLPLEEAWLAVLREKV